MSHILQRLRQQLDDPLLVKTPKGMKPTERALALIEPVRSLLTEVEQLIQPPLEFEAGTSQRRFVLAVTNYMELLLIPALSGLIDQIAPILIFTLSAPNRHSRPRNWKTAALMSCSGSSRC